MLEGGAGERCGVVAAFQRGDDAPAGMALQGNLDPQLLIAGGAALERGVAHVLDSFRDSPHVFNLGHGITPQTPPENLGRAIELVRGWKR